MKFPYLPLPLWWDQLLSLIFRCASISLFQAVINSVSESPFSDLQQSSNTSDTCDTSDTSYTSNTSDTSDTSDKSDTSDISDKFYEKLVSSGFLPVRSKTKTFSLMIFIGIFLAFDMKNSESQNPSKKLFQKM